jgi:hypothetical protein
VVFILLGAVQIVATTVILIYATRYASSSYCASHARPSRTRNETERDRSEVPDGRLASRGSQ